MATLKLKARVIDGWSPTVAARDDMLMGFSVGFTIEMKEMK